MDLIISEIIDIEDRIKKEMLCVKKLMWGIVGIGWGKEVRRNEGNRCFLCHGFKSKSCASYESVRERVLFYMNMENRDEIDNDILYDILETYRSYIRLGLDQEGIDWIDR